ncbi:MAG: hypothetical protein KJ749_03470 [Planctomycetes bacterium]|nr:hypothetical protein [Planctomycetota bacterium]
MQPAPTNAYGRASITLNVSMQPGDNYRAAASCLQDAVVDQVDQTDADLLSVKTGSGGLYVANGAFSGYKVPVVWSPMLTVWRKLWIERDTMAAPDPTEPQASGYIQAISPTPDRPGLTSVRAFPINFNSEMNNYEEGELVFINCPTESDTFPIVENYPGNDLDGVPHEIIILGTPDQCADVGTAFTACDDDDVSALGTGSSPRFPAGGNLLSQAFQPAYILPVYAGEEYRDVFDFEVYINYWEILTGEGAWNNGDDMSSTTDFWSCLLVGAWEGSDDRYEIRRSRDGDPDHCFTLFAPHEERPGAESPLQGVRRPGATQCLVFFQALADEALCADQTDEEHTVVHEIAHTCDDLPHKFGTIMQEGAPKSQNSFDSEQLNILRDQDAW